MFSDRREFYSAVQAHVAQKTPLIVVGGGDGTFSSIAHLFASQSSTLGVLPLGTGNSFARDLGITPNLDLACDQLVNGKVAKVDMGIIGDRNFLNVATIGLTSEIVHGLDSRAKRVLGRAVYLLSVLRALGKVHHFVVKLDLPSGTSSFECLQLVIGNGRFHAGPFPISADASITAPFLAVYALATRNKSAFIKMAVHMVTGGHVNLPDVRYFRVQSGSFNTVPAQDIIVDGEACLRTPASFSMAERALSVVVPQAFEG